MAAHPNLAPSSESVGPGKDSARDRRRRSQLTGEALALFDEIAGSGTSWSEPNSVDELLVNIILPEIRIKTPADCRKLLVLVLEGATVGELGAAVQAIREDAEGMRASRAEALREARRAGGRSKAPRPTRRAA